MKYLCFEQFLEEDCYLIFTDCDNSLEWWDEDIVQKFLKEIEDSGCDFLGCRMNYTWSDFLNQYKSQTNREHGIFWQKIFNYDLDINNTEWNDARLPAEHLLVFLNTKEKLKKFYEQFKWFYNYLLNKGYCYGTWAEGFEIGVAGLVAGYKPYDIGWNHHILSRAIKYNGHKIEHEKKIALKNVESIEQNIELIDETSKDVCLINEKEDKDYSNVKVIISMTTVPNRLNDSTPECKIGPVIERMTSLSYSNYELHLNIPHVYAKTGEEYNIPEWILNKQSEIFKIFRTDDYGAVTKILPTLERIKDPEQIIITVDDDLEYIDGFIEYHLKKRKIYPNAALGFAGISGINGECHFCTTVNKDVRVKILEGYKTASYKRKFFKDDFKEFSKGSWADDIIISAYLGKNDIHKIVMNYDQDIKFDAVVESFPVVRILPNDAGGCTEFRKDNICDNSNFYYKEGYLEK